MADITVIDEKTIKIAVTLEDALTMISEAANHLNQYADDIITIADKMPEFQYTYFCFYAYDSAALFEHMLGIDPKQYLSFSLDAPDSFFYTLYGGMKGLYPLALKAKASEVSVAQQSIPNELGDQEDAKSYEAAGSSSRSSAASSDEPGHGALPSVVELDVRPQLRAGEEPFRIIMDTFDQLQPEQSFVLHATFKPVPLIPLLEGKGYTATVENMGVNELDEEHWKVTFAPKV